MHTIRTLEIDDIDVWLCMSLQLWPEISPADHRKHIKWMLNQPATRLAIGAFDNGKSIGFAEMTVRKFANGCKTSPAPFLEGIWVDPDKQRQGIAKALLDHLENWCRTQGYREIGSDVEQQNHASHHAHRRWGFEPTEQVIYYRKDL